MPGLGLYWRAWATLRDDRHRDSWGGASRIYFSAIDAYARRLGLADREFETFVALLRALDDEYLQHLQQLEEKRGRRGEVHLER
ncbi:MAG: hypothetical protein AB7P16_28665 [Bradyrhizobium sp.]|uniref:phage tail assembly chaperone n=1 Tax=Bradyrhizobium sp. TaxID=376 RepID=UPI003D142D73